MLKPGVVVGHGIDLVDIETFGRLFTPLTSRYLNRIFTEDELSFVGYGVNQIQRLAGRFAVKEAVLKALGRGWGNGIGYPDIEVVSLESGAPTVVLYRLVQDYAEQLNINEWSLSISHTKSATVASVIGLRMAH